VAGPELRGHNNAIPWATVPLAGDEMNEMTKQMKRDDMPSTKAFA
jgi:hypothetical protein